LRFGANARRKALSLLAGVVVMGSAGYVTYCLDGLGHRQILAMSGGLVAAGNVKNGPDATEYCPVNIPLHPDFLKNCMLHINPRARVRVVVWGDSHARHWELVFRKIATDHDLEPFVVSHGGCPPLVGVWRPDAIRSVCKSVGGTANILRAIIELKPDYLFIASRWPFYTDGFVRGSDWEPNRNLPTEKPRKQATGKPSHIALEHGIVNTIAELRAAGIDPIIIGSLPVLKGDPRRRPIADIQMTGAEFQVLNAPIYDIFRRVANLRVFEPASELCNSVCSGSINGNVIYWDDNHLNVFGSMAFERDLLKILGIDSDRPAPLH
jgi:SGNH domain (fused to AT3 domains)